MAHWPSGSLLMASCLSAHSAPAIFAVVSAPAPPRPASVFPGDAATEAGAGAEEFPAGLLVPGAAVSAPLRQPATSRHAKTTAAGRCRRRSFMFVLLFEIEGFYPTKNSHPLSLRNES